MLGFWHAQNTGSDLLMTVESELESCSWTKGNGAGEEASLCRCRSVFIYIYIIAASFEFCSTVLSKHRNTLSTKVLVGRCNAFPLRYIYSRAHDILGKTVS